jgi:hypothetical protein
MYGNLNKTLNGNVIFFVIPAILFLTLALFKLLPFNPAAIHNNLNDLLWGVDDWNRYARHAMDIKYVDWLIPGEHGVYNGPGGFLYNYFLAACFIVFGNSVIPVYLVQVILLSVSISLTYTAFKNLLTGLSSKIFFIALILIAWLDVYRYYTFILMSECLTLFFISVFIFNLTKYVSTGKNISLLLSSLFLGLSIATRPTLFPAGFAFILFVVWFACVHKKQGMIKIILPVAILYFCMSLLAIRNYLVTGDWAFLPVLGVSDSMRQFNGLTSAVIFQKILYFFGYLPAFDKAYNIRPHWLIMWLGYIMYLVINRRSMPTFHSGELFIHLFIILYYISCILFVQVNSYGYRALLPVILLMVVFAVRGYEAAFTFLLKRKNSPA